MERWFILLLDKAAELFTEHEKEIMKMTEKLSKNKSVLNFFREWRIITASFILFMCVMSYNISAWFITLIEPTNSQSAFASAVILAVVGLVKFWTSTSASKGDE